MKAEETDLVDGVDDTHALFLAPVEIQMPSGELPVARDGTMGGVPSYQADPPKPHHASSTENPFFGSERPCGCPGNEVCPHGTPALLMGLAPTTRDEYLGLSRDNPPTLQATKPAAKKKAAAKR